MGSGEVPGDNLWSGLGHFHQSPLEFGEGAQATENADLSPAPLLRSGSASRSGRDDKFALPMNGSRDLQFRGRALQQTAYLGVSNLLEA